MIDLGTDKKALHRESAVSFTEIVGQAELKEALLAVGANDELDGLLIRGEKGTGKSTSVRALSELLPPQTVIAGCPYGCPPDAPERQCEACRGRTDPETDERSVPLVTLPLGATRERVVGTLSVADALSGEYEFDSGLLARANRGILYIDEVNLLDDHLVDVLLDAAASGINRVERDGVSVVHPAAFTLVGTMNPEEGDLRPQLRDRFALQATVTACEDLDQRVTIINRAIGQAENDRGSSTDSAQAVRDRIRRARARLEGVSLPRTVTEEIAECCRESGVEGHRGDIATARAAMTFAALDDRSTVTESDVRRAAALALPHRLQSRPFEDAPDAGDLLEEQFDGGNEEQDGESAEVGDEPADADGSDTDADGSTESDPDDAGDPPSTPPEESSSDDGDTDLDHTGSGGSDPGEAGVSTDTREDEEDSEDAPLVPGQARDDIGVASAPDPSPDASDAVEGALSGTRSRTAPRVETEGSRVRTQRAATNEHRLDAAASVRAAATRGSESVESRDLRHSIRRGETGALVVFVVDASASMRPAMRAAKGTVLELLKDAYQHRDEVAFVTVAGEGADVLLPPTDSVALAARHLKELPTGDRTPLPDGLRTASELLERAEPAVGLAVVVTDGKANVADGSPVGETRDAAARLADTAAHTLVVDAGDDPGLTDTIAGVTDGEHVPLEALSAERVDASVPLTK